MRVLLVNTMDGGGAANACLRLHDGLVNNQIESGVLFFIKSKKNINYYQFSKPIKKKTKLDRIRRRVKSKLKWLGVLSMRSLSNSDFQESRNRNLELFTFPNSDFDITESEFYKKADIINLHWVANFLDYSTFFKKNTKPVVWTLHDMNPFTGGEHYTEEYIGIEEVGVPKPRVVSENEKEIFKKVLKIKSEALKDCNNLHVVSLCNWMTEEVKKSELFSKFPVHQIPNGIDYSIFKPRDQNFSREIIGVPEGKRIILFVAESVANTRKGFSFLLDALNKIRSENYVLVAAGESNEKIEALENIIVLGSIANERLMSLIYSAADVFVIPSLMDNLPNTVLESLMCGTPVIGFPIGGIPDMIQHGENGLLTKEVSSFALANSIDEFLENSDLFNREKIRENAVLKYSLEVQAKAYTKLFKNIL